MNAPTKQLELFPLSMERDGKLFFQTGKHRAVIQSGDPSEEYESLDVPGQRVWLSETGLVMEE